VIKFFSGFQQVGGFLLDTPVSSTNKTNRHDITEILLKVALNIITKNEQKTEGSSKMGRKQKAHQKWAENRRVIKNEQKTEGSSAHFL
jgi:DNA topoisomerase VI subunit A